MPDSGCGMPGSGRVGSLCGIWDAVECVLTRLEGGKDFVFEVVFFEFDGGVGHRGNGIDHGEVFGRVGPEEFLEGVIAIFPKGLEELRGGEEIAGAVDGSGVEVADFAEEVGGELHLGFGAGDGVLVFEVILVAALDPVGEVLEVEALAGVAEFVNDDFVREAIIEHAVKHVAGLFGESGDLAVAAGIYGILDLRFLIFDCVNNRGGQ